MKKILALFLVLACALSVVSCNQKQEPAEENLQKFSDMFASSIPTKAVTVVTQEFNDSVELESVYTLTTGTVDGKTATTLVSSVQTLSDIQSGTLSYTTTKVTNEWYYEGMGTSTNKGKTWDPEGKNFAPVAGSLKMNLHQDYIAYYDYKVNGNTETLILQVYEENSAEVLKDFLNVDQDFAYETIITIVAAGERISSIDIEYLVYEHEVGTMENYVEVSDMYITIHVDYSYDIQAINFG